MALHTTPSDFSKDTSNPPEQWMEDKRIITHLDTWNCMKEQISACNMANVENLFIVSILLSHGICEGDENFRSQQAAHALAWLDRFSECDLSRLIGNNTDIASCFTKAVINVNNFGKADDGIKLVRNSLKVPLLQLVSKAV